MEPTQETKFVEICKRFVTLDGELTIPPEGDEMMQVLIKYRDHWHFDFYYEKLNMFLNVHQMSTKCPI